MTRWHIAPVLESAGADIVLSGHAHCYGHFVRENPFGQTHYFVVGGGGGTLDRVRTRSFRLALSAHSRYHILTLDVSDEMIEVRALDTLTNEVLDEVVVRPKARAD